MSDLRDTLILPCRHLCLCNCCADSLRYQANNCPICRAPFRALLQIKALQKSGSNNPVPPSEGEVVPPGYEAVSLIEALNGPSAAPPVQPNAPLYNEMYVRLPQNPGRGDTERSPTAVTGNVEDSTTQTESTAIDGSTQMRMSTLLAGQELLETELGIDSGNTGGSTVNSTDTATASRKKSNESRKHSKGRYHGKDSVKLVNENTKQVRSEIFIHIGVSGLYECVNSNKNCLFKFYIYFFKLIIGKDSVKLGQWKYETGEKWNFLFTLVSQLGMYECVNS